MAKKSTKDIKPKPEGYVTGRPTTYKPEFCQMLIEHMKQGYSYQSFPAICGCSIETLYNWEEKHQEFLDAKRTAFDLNRVFWEKVTLEATTGINPDANPTLVIFNLKNRFPKEWRDRQEIQSEVKQQIEVSVIDVSERLKKIKDSE